MKKIITVSLILLLVTIVTVGATYAFFTATTGSSGTQFAKSDQLEVIYKGDAEISGNLNLVRNKDEGHRRQVSISLSEISIDALANIYIYVEEIDEPLATGALEWEIYKINKDNTETILATGDFLDCGAINEPKSKCTNGDRIYMHTNIDLLTKEELETIAQVQSITDEAELEALKVQKFAIYIWLNGYEAGNEVVGASFTGYIGAETQNITGDLS